MTDEKSTAKRILLQTTVNAELAAPCECGDGWRFSLHSYDDKFDVVRCTLCKKYASDEEAVAARDALLKAGWPQKQEEKTEWTRINF